MVRSWHQLVAPGLCLVAALCWIVMFLAGTDVWHDVGRPDFWNLAGAPYNDLRAFAGAFYVLFVVLSLNLILTVSGLVTSGSDARAGH